MRSRPPIRGIIFDYGNTLVTIDPRLRSRRTDYADVVAVPGARRLERHLRATGALRGGQGADFVPRFLEVRERNRVQAEETGREMTAAASLAEVLLAVGGRSLASDETTRALFEFFEPEMRAIVPLEGAGATLQALSRRGLRLALLSNATDAAYVAEVVRRFGWLGCFEPLAVSAAIGFRKPRAEAFDAVLARWPEEPAEVAMVGDSLTHDIAGAAARGLFTIHFAAIQGAEATASDGVVPDLTVHSHAELLEALMRPGRAAH